MTILATTGSDPDCSAAPLTLAFGPYFCVRPEPDFFAEVKSLLGRGRRLIAKPAAKRPPA